jgi:telomerase reverse transcriptase
MGKKRKRPIKDGHVRENQKQRCTQNNNRVKAANVSGEHASEHSHPVISIYYRQVVTLRQYLLQHIPVSSKSRHRKIASMHSYDPTGASRPGELVEGLSKLLDTTLVGVLKESSPAHSQEIRRELAEFTTSQDRSVLISTDTGPPCPQAEVR